MLNLYKKLKTYIYLIFGWLFVLPLTLILKRFIPQKYILFIGRNKSLFMDNVKYLYLYFYQKNIKINNLKFVFLTEDKKNYNLLKSKNLPVVFYPSWEAIKVILATKILIVDNCTWVKKFKGFFLLPTFKIQLWHGIGFKYIELMNKKDLSIQGIKGWLYLRKPIYDIVISTSEFYTNNVFLKAFKSKRIWETGYPRNDIFFMKETDLDLLGVDMDIFNLVKRSNKRIIIYAPTFRDSGDNPIEDGMNLKFFDDFLGKNNAILIIKLHPNIKYMDTKAYNNILFYPSNKDIYPILKYADILITDYSSIFMDFLLLNRPIIFFPYDYTKYIQFDREIQFDYNWITPGEKAFDFKSLLRVLEKTLKGEDNFKEKRLQIRKLAWKYVDGNACSRIVNNLRNYYEVFKL